MNFIKMIWNIIITIIVTINMKYIITETQAERIKLLRRINGEDWDWISEIVTEGIDLYNPCHYESKEDYMDSVAISSAHAYLLYYFDFGKRSETFSQLSDYIISLIKQRMGDDIIEHYEEVDPDCED